MIMGAGTTGSGRYLTGDFIGADIVSNEITAQATAAAAIDPEVDTIFEIGGQDSKYISLENGAIVDFMMNKVCAAGTGSLSGRAGREVGHFDQGGVRRPGPLRPEPDPPGRTVHRLSWNPTWSIISSGGWSRTTWWPDCVIPSSRTT